MYAGAPRLWNPTSSTGQGLLTIFATTFTFPSRAFRRIDIKNSEIRVIEIVYLESQGLISIAPEFAIRPASRRVTEDEIDVLPSPWTGSGLPSPNRAS